MAVFGEGALLKYRILRAQPRRTRSAATWSRAPEGL